jgi:hypothetical protein
MKHGKWLLIGLIILLLAIIWFLYERYFEPSSYVKQVIHDIEFRPINDIQDHFYMEFPDNNKYYQSWIDFFFAYRKYKFSEFRIFEKAWSESSYKVSGTVKIINAEEIAVNFILIVDEYKGTWKIQNFNLIN